MVNVKKYKISRSGNMELSLKQRNQRLLWQISNYTSKSKD